ncbi:hypothetical protein ACOBQX_04645 [Actinokineospora sp. G85]|uniref:hypothetical protein n=1 Tax=Actinokineospora sp. G85 TaxID=3406626 RepID=UPI003C73E1CE
MTDYQGRFRELRDRLREAEADPSLPLDTAVDDVAALVSDAIDHVHAVITAATADTPGARRPTAQPRKPAPEARPATVRNIVSRGNHGTIIQAGAIHGSVHLNGPGH